MPRNRAAITNIAVQPDAQELAAERVQEFGAAMLLEAKLCATIDNSGLVLKKHVDEAAEKLQPKHGANSTIRVAIGGALFGAFIQGFITELAANNQILVVVYTLLGLLGMFLVLWDLRR
jgi:hypothetical protein